MHSSLSRVMVLVTQSHKEKNTFQSDVFRNMHDLNSDTKTGSSLFLSTNSEPTVLIIAARECSSNPTRYPIIPRSSLDSTVSIRQTMN